MHAYDYYLFFFFKEINHIKKKKLTFVFSILMHRPGSSPLSLILCCNF